MTESIALNGQLDFKIIACVTLNDNNEEVMKIEKRLAKRTKVLGASHKLLRRTTLSSKTKIKITLQNRNLISSANRCETWIMTESNIEKLQRWERKVPRKVFRGK